MKNLFLIGAGGHAKSCIDVIEGEGKYKIAGLIDLEEKIGEKVLGYPIIDSDANIGKYVFENNYFLITLGQIKSAQRRTELFRQIKNSGGNLATVVAKDACVSKYAEIGEGTIVMHGAVVNAAGKIGRNCIINTKALIEHDARVEDYCHISTGAILNGGVEVGQGSFIGSNSTVVQGVKLPAESFIKVGCLVK